MLTQHQCIGEMENREIDDDAAYAASINESKDLRQVLKFKYDRLPIKIGFEDSSQRDERYGGSGDMVILEGELIKPRNNPSKTVTVFMHPSGIQNLLPLPNALARAGMHVVTCCSRYPNNDTCLIMEKVLVDLNACICHLKEKLGYKKVILAGWSGGGSLSSFYQGQAEHNTVSKTPAGDPIDLSHLTPADGLLILAAHTSRAKIFTEWLDPSVLDESQPEKRELNLDIYANGWDKNLVKDEAYVKKYRQAQIERNRRITEYCVNRLKVVDEELKTNVNKNNHKRNKRDEVFTIQYTQADIRRAGSEVGLEELSKENHSPVGLGRVTTLRSFLSQWSYDLSNADGPKSLEAVTVPVLVLGNEKDHLVPLSHPKAMYNAVQHQQKHFVVINGATHYYFGQKKLLAKAAVEIMSFLRKQKLLENSESRL